MPDSMKPKAKEKHAAAAIEKRLPALHKQIRAAKKLHSKYLHLRSAAQTAQRKADEAKVRDLKLRRAVHFDSAVLHRVKGELRQDEKRYAAMGH